MNVAVVIFIFTYVLIALGENSPRKLDRPTSTLLGAVLMIISGALNRQAAFAAINFSTLGLLFGMMVLIVILLQSGFPTWLASRLLSRCRHPQALLFWVVLAGGLSAPLMLNDTVCLLGTPLILEITAQAGVSAIPFLLALATSANIGSVMTLTGNPQNMIIGYASGWTWAGFALRMAPIGLLCLIADWVILSLLFLKILQKGDLNLPESQALSHKVDWPLATKSVIAFVGMTGAFLFGFPLYLTAVTAATFLLVWANRPPRQALAEVDWGLLLFFAGLFVVTQGFVKAESSLLSVLENHLNLRQPQVSWGTVWQFSGISVLGSNLFSNVPLVLILRHWVDQAAHPSFFWLVLALTSTLAGNLTLFGSMANIIVAQGSLGRAKLRYVDFLWVGIPVTVMTSVIGVICLVLFHYWGWL
jgi:Na+/H+ antiporter NhaD/arsenite permease-like protein